MSDSTTATPKKVLIVASNPVVSDQTGWPIGFWWAELTHPYWEFVQRGYDVTIASPEGGAITADSFSDPEDTSGYSASDILSLGFKKSATHAALLENTAKLSDVNVADYDAVMLIGGQGPMYTFKDNPIVNKAVRQFYEAGKPTALVCHATCALLDAKGSNGELIVEGKTWTGFSNEEERQADAYVGQKIQPYWIEDEARRISGTTFVVGPPFVPFAVQDGNLITGQQQFSGAETARTVIAALER